MAFTVRDYQDMVRLLDQHPEWQVELRRLMLADDFLALPAIVRDLAEAQQRTEERLERLEATVQALAEAQQRTEERLERLEATMQALAEAQQRTEERLERLEATVQALAEAQQRTEERLERLEATVQALAEAQQRTEERLERLEATVQALTVAQQRTEEQLGQLAADVRALTGEVQRLADWQRGEAGRREGERYEQRIARRAPVLFNGGQGGTPDESTVYQRLLEILRRLPNLAGLSEERDPMLTDLIWWKNGQYAVIEVSLVVNGYDVARAARRADTLSAANVQAVGVVIGEEWLGEEAREQAAAQAVHWRVGDDLSDGYLAFCRRPA